MNILQFSFLIFVVAGAVIIINDYIDIERDFDE
jgi:4-hydroxybenzoate polyprenyltransferase